jgi:hypothetical protein
VNDAIVSRMNLWLVVALVAAIALLAAVTFVTLQPIVGHWIGAALHGASQMACSGTTLPC